MTVAGQVIINYTFDNDDKLSQAQQGSAVLAFGYTPSWRGKKINRNNIK